MTRSPSGIGCAAMCAGTLCTDASSTSQVMPSSMRAISVRGKRASIVSQWSRTNSQTSGPYSRLVERALDEERRVLCAHRVGGGELARAEHELLAREHGQ